MKEFIRNLLGIRSQKKRIYLDNAAATPLDSRILKKMEPYFTTHIGNASALHQEGIYSKDVLDDARKSIAHSMASQPKEIIFTSGGTEANNLAIVGYMNALEKKEKSAIVCSHIITSSAEHPSVLDCCRLLEKRGVSVDYIDFDTDGIINPKDIRKLLRKETVFVSLSYVNNEIGTVQPIQEIAKEIRAHEKDMGIKVIFHTDASQAPLYFDCTPRHLGVDLMTIDGQKIYGPKGVGFLYKQKEIILESIMQGGGQEYGLRPGTENIPLIVGIKEAFTQAVLNRGVEGKKIKELQEYFFELLQQHIPQAILNGDTIQRSPSNINISIPGMDNEYLVIALDEHGIASATKSACLPHGSNEYSYVVASLYRDEKKNVDMAKNAIRFSLGRGVSRKDIQYVISILRQEVEKLDKIQL